MIAPHILACHDDEFCSMIIILVTYLIYIYLLYYIIKSIILALFYYHYLWISQSVSRRSRTSHPRLSPLPNPQVPKAADQPSEGADLWSKPTTSGRVFYCFRNIWDSQIGKWSQNDYDSWILYSIYIHMIIHVCVSLYIYNYNYIYTYIWPTHLQAIAFLMA